MIPRLIHSLSRGYLSQQSRARIHPDPSKSLPFKPPVTARSNILIISFAVAIATSATTIRAAPSTALNSIPAKSWAEQAAAREVDIVTHTGSYLRYKQREIDAKGDDLRDVIESKDGSVARLVMRDNRPLTSEEDKAERDRLAGLLEHPADYARHVKNDASSKKMAIDLIRLMPTAMIYSYAPDQAPTVQNSSQLNTLIGAKTNTPQIVLDYSPDPGFNPPTTTSSALTGLRGRIWIDANSKTIVRMTGEIFQPVNFGWGMLARIYPGGTLNLEQADVQGGRWNMTRFTEQVTARALMVKTIDVRKEFRSLDFEQMPGAISFQDAIHLLLNTALPKKASAGGITPTPAPAPSSSPAER